MGDFLSPFDAGMKVEEVKDKRDEQLEVSMGLPPDAEKKQEELIEEVTKEYEPTLLEKYYESAKLLHELSKDRLISNIPSTDDYWKQLAVHRKLFSQIEEEKKYKG